MKAIKVDAAAKMSGMSEKKVRNLNSFKQKTRVKMSVVVKRLGQENDDKQEWLVLTPKNKMAKPEKVRSVIIMPKVVITLLFKTSQIYSAVHTL